MRRVSKKRAASSAKQRRVVAAVRERDGRCVHLTPGPCTGEMDPHHVWRQSQGGPWEPWNLVCLCRGSHSWVHDHPLVSQSLGLLVPAHLGGADNWATRRLRSLARHECFTFAPWLTEEERIETASQDGRFVGAPTLENDQ